jgi:foldase protein PrsA
MPKTPKKQAKKTSLAKRQTAVAKGPVTNATIDKHRKEVIKKGRRLRRPLSLTRRRVLVLTASILLAIVLVLLGVTGYLIYGRQSDGKIVYGVSRIVPYPVSRVNGQFISYGDYLFELRYRKNLYENPAGPASTSQEPVDFKSEEGKKLLDEIKRSSLEEAKKKTIVRQLAKDNDVKVSDEEVDKSIAELIKRQGGEKKFKDAIEEFYGWSMEDFTKELRLQLVRQKLQLKLLPAESGEQKAKAEALRDQARGGADFAQLAKDNSQDPGSKEQGGDLGVIKEDTPFVEEFKQAALKLQPGEVSEVVPTQFGFHVIKAVEKNDQGLRVAHILIEYTKDIETLINDKLNAANVKDYIKLPAASQDQAQPQAS